ncbi:DNA (cytosine-5)-methyltransferase 1 [Amycolatopsis marina]|uniref:DNA (cytosine-5-)-methyltransferase n=2 Tax=Amycolatopsis marina TaxID=490629 RepID=A0A1I1CGT3_9PSEU|nr:DNA (cytosine-5)-methyltransferase 1 [Amycolatopsis marina]
MHEVGFRHLLCNEYSPRACETLLENRAMAWKPGSSLPTSLVDRWPLIQGDVRLDEVAVALKEVAGKVDVVAGGPPCQPFSLGGVHKGDEDERNMFPELFRVVREVRPRAIICENVRGLMRPSFRPYFDYILRELGAPFVKRKSSEDWEVHDRRLRRLGEPTRNLDEYYDVYPIPVNAADYGVPQVRQRVIIVAFRKDLNVSWEPPERRYSEASLVRDQRNGDYWDVVGRKPKPEVIAMRENAKFAPEDLEKSPWRTLRQAIAGLPEPIEGEQTGPIEHHIGWPGARIYKGHTPNLLDRPAKTVKAGVHGVPGGESVMLRDDGTHRYMTVRETARVMTFPDSWRLAGPRGEQMRQLGNAVPVLLGKVFAQAVANALKPSVNTR